MDILNITKNGKLYRKDNSLVFEFENEDKIKIPIMKINVINVYSNITFNSSLFEFLNKQNISVNFFQPFSGNYMGTFLFKDIKMSSTVSMIQIDAYQNNKFYYVKKFYTGIIYNMLYVLKKYQKNQNYGKEITKIMKEINNLLLNIENEEFDYSNYLLFEASVWRLFYSSLDLILIKDFKFEKRTKRPPENRVNSLISFINMKLYAQIFNTMKITQLDYRIGYVHAIQGNRFSLVLDIADIFKPVLSLYFIIYILNNKKITIEDFEKRKITLNGNGSIFRDITSKCMKTLQSNEWTGYWQGNHRISERLGVA